MFEQRHEAGGGAAQGGWEQSTFGAESSRYQLSGHELIEALRRQQDQDQYRTLHWQGTFEEYLGLVRENPAIARTAVQRLHDLIVADGAAEYSQNGKRVVHYNFFDDPHNGGRDAVFGLDPQLMKLVNIFDSAAHGYGTEKRILLLRGPVGSAKSTIARLLKHGIERYSRTAEGALYTFGWMEQPGTPESVVWTPMNEEPLQLVPSELRPAFLKQLRSDGREGAALRVQGEICPFSRFMFQTLMERYDGDLTKVLEHVRVKRLVLSEADRIGIGTFEPKDEKNQDSTELVGDVNWRKMAELGRDSDPRAYNFDGELCVANRGIAEFPEMLKLDVAFLYTLLNASQDQMFKPKKFPQTFVDTVILGHTNEPEFRRLQNNEFMEALRDRTIPVDIPYVTVLGDEKRVYQKDFNSDRVGMHVAPHTIEVAAMVSVLSRLDPPKKADLTLVQKMRLYDGKTVPGYTDDTVAELRKESEREGLAGISPRFIQDTLSAVLVDASAEDGINAFMVLEKLEAGLDSHPLITSEEKRKRFKQMIEVAAGEFKDAVLREVQMAIAADEGALSRLFDNYILNVKAYTQKDRIKNPISGKREEPDEKLMRSIEEKAGVPESRKDDYRREVIGTVGAMALDGKSFDYTADDRLYKALQAKLFEDQRDSAFNLRAFMSAVKDPEAQQKIDLVKQRLKENYGYNERSATDILRWVASSQARGDAME